MASRIQDRLIRVDRPASLGSMVAVVLALVTAAVYGTADFCGGLATKRASLLSVLAGSHIVGAVGVVVVSIIIDTTVTGRDLALGVFGGLFGLVGVGLLYRRLAIGPMGVVAPLTGLTAAVVPAAWGVADGDRLTAVGWLGVVLALVAVGLVSAEPGSGKSSDPDRPSVTPAVVIESLLAGVGFGVMFICLDQTDPDSAPWPVASARLTTAPLLAAALLATRAGWLGRRASGAEARSVAEVDEGTDGEIVVETETEAETWSPAVLGLIAAVGLLDTGANVTFLYATIAGQLTVVSVLSALYPIATVMLALVVLGERLTRLQIVGLVAALAGTELLVLG